MGRRKQIEDEELLAVARAAFVAEGFGASTKAIALRASVSEAVLFQRFQTKAGLFFAAMAPAAPDIPAILGSSAAAGSTQFEAIALRVLDYFREITPVLLPLISHPGFDYQRFVRQHPEAPLNVLVEGLRSWLSQVERAGASTSEDADVAAMALVSSLMGLALFERMGVHGGETEEGMVREMAAMIWRGLVSVGDAGGHGDGRTR